MRTIDQAIMNRLFAVTDALDISREAITVPLIMEGEGNITRDRRGRFEITLPDTDDLEPFLAELPDRLRALGA